MIRFCYSRQRCREVRVKYEWMKPTRFLPLLHTSWCTSGSSMAFAGCILRASMWTDEETVCGRMQWPRESCRVKAHTNIIVIWIFSQMDGVKQDSNTRQDSVESEASSSSLANYYVSSFPSIRLLEEIMLAIVIPKLQQKGITFQTFLLIRSFNPTLVDEYENQKLISLSCLPYP